MTLPPINKEKVHARLAEIEEAVEELQKLLEAGPDTPPEEKNRYALPFIIFGKPWRPFYRLGRISSPEFPVGQNQ